MEFELCEGIQLEKSYYTENLFLKHSVKGGAMSSHPVTLPSKKFKSKSEATKYFSEMLLRCRDGEEVDPIDVKILFELLQRHPKVREKIGPGVKRFYRDKSPTHPTSCFHLERCDGTTTDFSFLSCISGTADFSKAKGLKPSLSKTTKMPSSAPPPSSRA